MFGYGQSKDLSRPNERIVVGGSKGVDGEPVAVNLRLDTDLQTEFVAFDRPRVMKVIERIAAELDELARHGLEPLCVDLTTVGDADHYVCGIGDSWLNPQRHP